MTLIARRKAQQNASAIDPWTMVHFAAGLAAGLVDMDTRKAMALSLGYEVIEQFFERNEAGQKFFNVSRPESAPNAVIDVLVFALGHQLGRAWNRS